VQTRLGALEHPCGGGGEEAQPFGRGQIEKEISGEAKLERVKGIEPSPDTPPAIFING